MARADTALDMLLVAVVTRWCCAMRLGPTEKRAIQAELVQCLKNEAEVRKVIVFGSFLSAADPDDLDVAIFQDSDEAYLPLAMKYRRLTRSIANRIPMAVIPLRFGVPGGQLVREIQKGQVVYERQH